MTSDGDVARWGFSLAVQVGRRLSTIWIPALSLTVAACAARGGTVFPAEISRRAMVLR